MANKKKFTTITITEGSKEPLIIGKYYEEDNIFKCNKEFSKDFNTNSKSWGLDLDIVRYLASKGAYIELTDKETKWAYGVQSELFIVHGNILDRGNKRDLIYLNLDYWEILRAKNRTKIVECRDTTCYHNRGLACILGGVTIGACGKCINYSERGQE